MTAPSLLSRTSSFRSLLLGALLVAASASAATGGTVVLGGTVASSISLTATQAPAASGMDMDGDGTPTVQHVVKVSELVASTNNFTGLTLSISSGDLSNGTHSVPYQVGTVVGGAAAPTTFSIASGTPNVEFAPLVAGIYPRDLYIAYSPPQFLEPGDYVGTITLGVEDRS